MGYPDAPLRLAIEHAPQSGRKDAQEALRREKPSGSHSFPAKNDSEP